MNGINWGITFLPQEQKAGSGRLSLARKKCSTIV